MAGRETYDISSTQRKILEARAARRTLLRHEYLKQIGNPYRGGEGGSVFDTGLQRFSSMKATAQEFFRPNPRNSIFYITAVIAPILAAMYIIIGDKDRQELKYRTGQVSYRDREFKFT